MRKRLVSFVSVVILTIGVFCLLGKGVNHVSSDVKVQIKQRNPVVNEGNSIQLDAVDRTGKEVEVNWISGSPDIAEVDPKTGEVKGIKQGFATITANSGSDSVSVFVVVARIRKGNGEKVPGDTKVDSSGQLYISSPMQNVIYKATDVLTGNTQVYAGYKGVAGKKDGERNEALFAGPTGIGVDNRVGGGVYTTDTLNHSIRKIGFNGLVETIIGGKGPGISSFVRGRAEIEEVQLNSPRGVAVDVGGNLYVSDTDNHAIYYIDFAKKEVRVLVGEPGRKGAEDGIGEEARFSRPSGLGLSSDGKVLAIADQDNNRVRLVEIKKGKNGEVTGEVSTVGTIGNFVKPQSVSIDGVGNINVVDEKGVYVITRPRSEKEQVVELAQREVSFKQAVSVTIKGTESIVMDAEGEGINVVTVGAPEIDELSQEKVKISGGEEITIKGKNFAPESKIVLGDGEVKEYEVKSATEIRLKVPKQELPGERILTVQTRGGIAQRKIEVLPKPISEMEDGEANIVLNLNKYTGDGGLATSGNIALGRHEVAIDGLGNLFITDTDNNRIRRIDVDTGIITTIAGTGVPSSDGDGGLALTATLNHPSSIKVDKVGNLFFFDWSGRVRRIDAGTGIITTVAGNGSKDEDNIPAIEARLSPFDLDIDDVGNIFIAGTTRVRRVDAKTGIITTVAGNGKVGSSGDGGLATEASINLYNIALDSSGNLFIAEYERIRRVDAKTGIITTIAGNGKKGSDGDGGPAVNAAIDLLDIAVDKSGNVFLIDLINTAPHYKLRKIDINTGIITTIPLTIDSQIQEIEIDGLGNLFISSYGAIYKVNLDETEKVAKVVGNSSDGAIFPRNLTIDNIGNLFVASDNRVHKFDTNSNILNLFAGNGKNESNGDGGPATEASITPGSVAVDSLGNLFDLESMSIRRVDKQTGIITTINKTLKLFYGVQIAIDNLDNMFISTYHSFKEGRFFTLYRSDIKANNLTKVVTIEVEDQFDSLKFALGIDNKLLVLQHGFKKVPKIIVVNTNTSNTKVMKVKLPRSDVLDIATDQNRTVFLYSHSQKVVYVVDLQTGKLTEILKVTKDRRNTFLTSFMEAPKLAIDKNNNLFIADIDNGVIRVIKNVSSLVGK